HLARRRWWIGGVAITPACHHGSREPRPAGGDHFGRFSAFARWSDSIDRLDRRGLRSTVGSESLGIRVIGIGFALLLAGTLKSILKCLLQPVCLVSMSRNLVINSSGFP